MIITSRQILRLALGCLCFAAILMIGGNLRGTLGVLSQISPQWIFVLLIISFLMVGISAVKWRLFLVQLGHTIPLARLFSLYLIGYFVNLFMPSALGGDIARSLIAARGEGRREAITATFLERYTGLVAMILMAVIAVFCGAKVTSEIQFAVLGALAGLIVGSIAAFLAPLDGFQRLPKRLRQLGEKVHLFQQAMRFGVGDLTLFARVSLLSLLFHALTIVNTIAVAWSIGWFPHDILGLAAVVPLILLVGAIPISPQGLGIQEGAFFFFLQSVGATPEEALAVALVLRAKGYVLASVGGMILFWERTLGGMPRSSKSTHAGQDE